MDCLMGMLKKKKHEMASRCGLVKRELWTKSASSNSPINTSRSISAIANTRTSSRKRKSKQLFSIENYDTPKKTDDLSSDLNSASCENGVVPYFSHQSLLLRDKKYYPKSISLMS